MSDRLPAGPRSMLIIAGHMRVDAARRDQVVAAHGDLLERARAFEGCLDIAITADPIDPARINNYERWRSREDLDAWRLVADPPDTGIELRDVEVMLYTAVDERPPFDVA